MRSDRGADLDFSGTCSAKGCDREAVAGQSKCERCRDASNARSRAVFKPISPDMLKASKHPRPAWMNDPSLLPKKPPGGRP